MIDEKEILKAAINLFGAEQQENMCIEECAELIQAINKKHRGKPHNIPEEIADVEITLAYLKLTNNCAEEVEENKQKKLQRLSREVALRGEPASASFNSSLGSFTICKIC